MKKKIFVAYSGKQQALAEQLRDALRRDFDILLWTRADWAGDSVLDNIINAIHGCEYGIALLSCDDKTSDQSDPRWLPRNNVVLELGYFLCHFEKERTAIVRVSEQDGRSPDFPSDIDGWLDVRLTNPASQENVKTAAWKIRNRFNNTKFLLSIEPRGSASRGFNVLSIHNALRHWGNFEGEFFCINPSWTLELEKNNWLAAHYQRYRSPRFTQANYVIDIDRGADSGALDGTSVTPRLIDKRRDLAGLIRFIDALCGTYKDVAPEIEKKLRIYIRPGIRTELTTFVGSLNGCQRGFLFVRRLTDKATVLEARSPDDVVRMRDHIQTLMGADGYFTPSQARELHNKLVRS